MNNKIQTQNTSKVSRLVNLIHSFDVVIKQTDNLFTRPYMISVAFFVENLQIQFLVGLQVNWASAYGEQSKAVDLFGLGAQVTFNSSAFVAEKREKQVLGRKLARKSYFVLIGKFLAVFEFKEVFELLLFFDEFLISS